MKRSPIAGGRQRAAHLSRVDVGVAVLSPGVLSGGAAFGHYGGQDSLKFDWMGCNRSGECGEAREKWSVLESPA